MARLKRFITDLKHCSDIIRNTGRCKRSIKHYVKFEIRQNRKNSRYRTRSTGIPF